MHFSKCIQHHNEDEFIPFYFHVFWGQPLVLRDDMTYPHYNFCFFKADSVFKQLLKGLWEVHLSVL